MKSNGLETLVSCAALEEREIGAGWEKDFGGNYDYYRIPIGADGGLVLDGESTDLELVISLDNTDDQADDTERERLDQRYFVNPRLYVERDVRDENNERIDYACEAMRDPSWPLILELLAQPAAAVLRCYQNWTQRVRSLPSEPLATAGDTPNYGC